jgi:fructoselysine-6-P-deglycase FrlB-like protein
MLQIEHEIASQPETWRRAAALAPEVAPELPSSGERLAVVGCGTSYFMAQALAVLRERSGHGETDAFPASEMPVERRYDAVLALSRSGTTTEVVRALERVPDGVATVAICAVAGTEVATTAARRVILDFADEQAIVQTRFATTALALMRALMTGSLAALADEADEALAAPLPVDPVRFDQFVFLGAGWSVGLASEAALKLREAAGVWCEAYPAMEYRHGPVSATRSTTLVWALGAVEPGVLESAARAGATVVDSGRDPMAELVVVQRAAVALARGRGLDPNRPRHLSRSVVLDDGRAQAGMTSAPMNEGRP